MEPASSWQRGDDSIVHPGSTIVMCRTAAIQFTCKNYGSHSRTLCPIRGVAQDMIEIAPRPSASPCALLLEPGDHR